MAWLAATLLLVPVVLVAVVFALAVAKCRHQPDTESARPPSTQPRARAILRNWRYYLSFLLPMPFTSTYGVWVEPNNATAPANPPERPPDRWEHAFWVQWRSRIWLHRTRPADPPNRGGYSSLSRLASQLRRPPTGPAPGGRLPYANAPPWQGSHRLC